MADLLTSAALLAYRRDRFDDETTMALRAIEVATDVDKPNEAARAHAVLACVAASRHQTDAVSAHVAAVRTGTSLPAHVEHLLREAERIGATRA